MTAGTKHCPEAVQTKPRIFIAFPEDSLSDILERHPEWHQEQIAEVRGRLAAFLIEHGLRHAAARVVRAFRSPQPPLDCARPTRRASCSDP